MKHSYMEWSEIEVNGSRSVKFPERALVPQRNAAERLAGNVDSQIGGTIKQGEWAWLAHGATLQIVSTRNGRSVASYEFITPKGYDSCAIQGVEEIFPGNPKSVILAVCLENLHGGSYPSTHVAIYSVEHSNVISCMELQLHVTCARFLDAPVCRRSLLQNFEGCLAVGSNEGIILLIDLNLRHVFATYEESRNVSMEENGILATSQCHIVDYNLALAEIHREYKRCQQEGVHFALQIEVIDSPCSIQCLLPIDIALALAVGYDDGRLAIYDLAELQIFHISTPESDQEDGAIVKMAFLEPPDDPRPCLYIWAIHEKETSLTAILHTLIYERRLLEENATTSVPYYFESFISASKRLVVPLESSEAVALACQSVSKITPNDDSHCLCMMSWYSCKHEKNKMLLFDLNQWYKEQMPYHVVTHKAPTYLAGFVLSGGQHKALHAYLNPCNIAHFSSIQRYEEHFYPNSLSFDLSLLLASQCLNYNWEGIQNRAINFMRCSNSSLFLEPDVCFAEILRTRLFPQFSELNANSTFSRNAKYEIILSVALENNCYSLLRDCGKCWADGSFMGNFTASTGLSLSTLTEWLWKRARDIKSRCNDLCKVLFDFSGYPLDQREKTELGFITRQLKLMADLLNDVLTISKKNIPEKIFEDLSSKYKFLRMASDYQTIVLWFLNTGLLPENSSSNKGYSKESGLVQFHYSAEVYHEIKQRYAGKRKFFSQINGSWLSAKTGSCRLLFIDSFIEHECKGSKLREAWLEANGDGLYPPPSLEAMLRAILVPELEFDSKCGILLYFFLDIHSCIDEAEHKQVVSNLIKFPSVFNMPAALVKMVQAFWNLDNGQCLPAVEEFISPFNNNKSYPQWLLEMLIESLLAQNEAHLALRILDGRNTLVAPLIKLKTFLANELISEAFHFVRSTHDEHLVELFFTACLNSGRFGVIRDLALTEREGKLVERILRNRNNHSSDSLHLVFLLQKSKYIEAVSYMDEVTKTKRSQFDSSTMDTPNLVLSAFNTTITPVTQGLTDVYFRIKNKIKQKEAVNDSPEPLSCQLTKQNATSLLGGIYHSSALSAHFATYYWGEMLEKGDSRSNATNLMSSTNAPFLRKPQVDTLRMDFADKNAMSYPQEYKPTQKRNLTESELLDTSNNKCPAEQQPKKRRRVGNEEILKDLTHFAKLNSTSMSRGLDVSDFSIIQRGQKEDPRPSETNESFLIRPAPKVVEYSQPLITTRPEIQGILKVHTPEPLLQRQRTRSEAVAAEEEKNLRFRLPKNNLNTSDTTNIERTLEEPEDMDTNVTESEEMVIVQKPVRKQVVRSISVESDANEESPAPEEDQFYSPMSTMAVAAPVDSGLDSSLNELTGRTATQKYSFLSGPHPRKPLSRCSSERSVKSVTPEPSAAETKKTEISQKSSGLQESMAAYSVQESSKMVTARSSIAEETSSNSLYKTAPQIASQFSSGFISGATESTPSELPSTTKPSSMVSLGSRMYDFVPSVSSSRVCETQSKFVKLSECSTVVGGLTYTESVSVVTSKETQEYQRTGEYQQSNKSKEHQRKPAEDAMVMDTTLGMSSYDFSTFDATHSKPQPPKGDDQEKDDNVYSDVYLDETSQRSSEEKDNVESSFHDELLEVQQDIQMELDDSDSVNQIYDDGPIVATKKVDDAVIVLSSSSSSGSASPAHSHVQEEHLYVEEDSENTNDQSSAPYSEDDDDEQEGEDNEANDTEEDDTEADSQSRSSTNEDLQMGETSSPPRSLVSSNEDDYKPDGSIDIEADSSRDVEEDSNVMLTARSYLESEEAKETQVDNESLATSENSNNAFVSLVEDSESSSVIPGHTSKLFDSEVDTRSVYDNLVMETVKSSSLMDTASTSFTSMDVMEAAKESADSAVSHPSETLPDDLFEEAVAPVEKLEVSTTVEGDDREPLMSEDSQQIDSEKEKEPSPEVAEVVVSQTDECDDQEEKPKESAIERLSTGDDNLDRADQEFIDVDPHTEEKMESPKPSDAIQETNKVAETSETLNPGEAMEVAQLPSESPKETESLPVTAEQSDAPASVTAEQSEVPASVTAEQSEVPASVTTEQSDAPASVTIEQSDAPASVTAEQSEVPASVTAEQSDVPAPEMTAISPEKSEADPSTPNESPSKSGSDSLVTTPHHNRKKTLIRAFEMETLTSSPGPSSAQDADDAQDEAAPVSKRRLSRSRAGSVPPATVSELESNTPQTPRTRRSVLGATATVDELTPRTRRELRGRSVEVGATEVKASPRRQSRGSSVPPKDEEHAPSPASFRRRAILNAIAEDENTPIDSPSTRTRSRMRLNSESEADLAPASVEKPKRTRRTSVSSNVSETPTRKRRNSVVSQPDDDAVSVDSTPSKSGRSTRRSIAGRRVDVSGGPQETDDATKAEASHAEYSSSRRLTRTQLAVMEKSAKLAAASPNLTIPQKTSPVSADDKSPRSQPKRSVSRLSQRDSDAESIGSMASARERRFTRSSLKDKDEVDDDAVSVASSIVSTRSSRRRSKEPTKESPVSSKQSLNSSLGTITEDAQEESEIPRKRGRPSKK